MVQLTRQCSVHGIALGLAHQNDHRCSVWVPGLGAPLADAKEEGRSGGGARRVAVFMDMGRRDDFGSVSKAQPRRAYTAPDQPSLVLSLSGGGRSGWGGAVHQGSVVDLSAEAS